MPELPEVQTVVDYLNKNIVGSYIEAVELTGKKLRVPFNCNLESDLCGAEIICVTRKAKYILIGLSNNKIAIVHLGMSGKLVYGKASQLNKHDHVVVNFLGGQQLIFNDPRRFGLFVTVEKTLLNDHSLFAGNGPDPMTDEFSADYLYKKTKGTKRPIKQLLMDNSSVVGIGNIYACESLFLSGINPQMPSNQLTMQKCNKLVQQIKATLYDAISSGGSTLRDYVRGNGDVGYFQHYHNVYGKKGVPCKKCFSLIEMIRLGGRSTFFCSKCQI